MKLNNIANQAFRNLGNRKASEEQSITEVRWTEVEGMGVSTSPETPREESNIDEISNERRGKGHSH